MRKNRLIFYLLWILSLVGISFYGGVVSYSIFCALTLVPVVMYIYLLFVLFGFRIYQELSTKSVVCRTPVTYYFTLHNETVFSFAGIRVMFYEFGVDYGELNKDREYELMPDTGSRITTGIVCKYRGEYEIGIRKVVITDFLRLFSITYKNPSPLKVNVFPAVEFPDGEIVKEEPLFTGRSSENLPEVRDLLVRPYAEGDSLRSINWKATARNLKLMTANRISEKMNNVYVLVDTERHGDEPEEYLPVEDELLTRLITLVIYYVSRNISVDVYYYSQGMQHLTLKSMREFEDFYASVSAVVFTSDIDISAIRSDLLRTGKVTEANLVVLYSEARRGVEE